MTSTISTSKSTIPTDEDRRGRMVQLGCISLRNLAIFIATEVVVFNIPTGVKISVHGLGWCVLCLSGWLRLPRRQRCRQFLRRSPVTPGTGRVLCVDLDGETNYYYGGYGFDPSNYSYGRININRRSRTRTAVLRGS